MRIISIIIISLIFIGCAGKKVPVQHNKGYGSDTRKISDTHYLRTEHQRDRCTKQRFLSQSYQFKIVNGTKIMDGNYTNAILGPWGYCVRGTLSGRYKNNKKEGIFKTTYNNTYNRNDSNYNKEEYYQNDNLKYTKIFYHNLEYAWSIKYNDSSYGDTLSTNYFTKDGALLFSKYPDKTIGYYKNKKIKYIEYRNRKEEYYENGDLKCSYRHKKGKLIGTKKCFLPDRTSEEIYERDSVTISFIPSMDAASIKKIQINITDIDTITKNYEGNSRIRVAKTMYDLATKLFSKGDITSAEHLFVLSIDLGNGKYTADANMYLGNINLNRSKFKDAAKNYSIAAKDNILGANFNAGFCFYKSEDYEESLKFFRKIEKNNSDNYGESLNFIGLMTEKGNGTKQNKIKAYNYYMEAAKIGNKNAQENLDYLCKNSPWACKQ